MSAVLGIVLLVSGLYIHSAKHATLSNAVQTPGSASGVSEPKLIFDFLAEAPMARWMNGSGNILTWNGRNDDPKGFVLFVHNPHLENGSQPLNVLETHPEWKNEGQISGDYTLREQSQPCDRFRAHVGFLEGAGGEVEFVVEAQGGRLMGNQRVYSGRDSGNDTLLKTIDADLTPVAGGAAVRLVVNAG